MESSDLMPSKSVIEKKRREEIARKVEELKTLLTKFDCADRSKAEKAEVFAEVFEVFKRLLVQNGRTVDDAVIPPLVEPSRPGNMARKPYLEKLLREKQNYYYDAFRTLVEVTNGANCTNLDKLSTLEKTISCIQMLAANVSQNVPPPLSAHPPIALSFAFPQPIFMPGFVFPVPLLPQQLFQSPQRRPQEQADIWRPYESSKN